MRRVILYGDNRLRAHRPMLKPTFILMQQQCIYVIKYETGFLAVFGVSGSGGNITSASFLIPVVADGDAMFLLCISLLVFSRSN